jgi:uncharacterized membrane protein
MLIYLNYIPIVIFWSLGSYIKKALYKHINNYEYLLLSNLIYSIIFLGFFTYLINPAEFLVKLKKLPLNLYIKSFLVCFGYVLTTFALYNLIQNFNVNYIIPVARGFSQILILIFGFYFYKENITKCTIIGTLLIVFGIYLI